MASQLQKEFQDDREGFVNAWKTCLPQVPFKITLFATLTGLLNARSPEMGKVIVEAAVQTLNKALDECHFRSAKLLVRYLADLANCRVIHPTQLVGLFDTLLSVTLEPNVKQERSDTFVFIVMAALPWASVVLRDHAPQALERLVAGFEEYMVKRQEKAGLTGLSDVINALGHFRDCEGEEPFSAVDRLTLLWNQIQALKLSQWECQLLSKPYLGDQDISHQSVQHELGPITVTSLIVPVKFDYQPVFWVFDDSLTTGPVI